MLDCVQFVSYYNCIVLWNAFQDSYGPYLGQDGYCRLDKAEMGFKIKGWVNVTSGDTDALKVFTTTLKRPKVSSLYIGRHRCPWACVCWN